MTTPSERLRALEAAALSAADRGDREAAAELAAELLRQDPDNAVARRVVAQGEVDPPGERRRLTVLFCDLVGSTGISSRLDPERYHRLLQRHHRMCADVIAAHEGTVNQRVGDGLLAVFGHPRSHEDDTRRAVRAGLELTEQVAAMRPAIEREFGESLEVRVAIHLGPVHVDLVDSAIYGLAPNVASRLQDLAEPGTVVVSDEVLDVVGAVFGTRSHPPRRVKGVEEPVSFHTVERELPLTPERGRSWQTPFIGRTAERRALREALASGSSVVVRGEAGIGKSRLVSEVLRDSMSSTHRVIPVLCTSYEQNSDLGAASALLQDGPSELGSLGPAERLQRLTDDLADLGLDPRAHTSLLAPLLGIAPSVGYDPPETDLSRVHQQVLSALRSWLRALAARQPLVVLVEDVQWADGSTLELLQGLVDDPIDGVQVVATDRSGGGRLRGTRLAVVELPPLPTEDAARLVTAVHHEIDEGRLAVALQKGQGNPLFLEELARAPDATGVVDPELMIRFMTESTVPGALYEPLLARLYSSGADVGLARAAATIGREFSRAVLAAVVPRPPEVLERGLQSLLDAGIVDAGGDDLYSFRHALIRDVAYDLQPREQRIQMHRRVGDALRAQREEGIDVSWSVIATHYHAAGRVDDAIDAYAAAADNSRERGSMQVGIDHLTTAIDLIEQYPRTDAAARAREIDLRLRRGFLCVSSGGNADPRAVADYDRCLELSRAAEGGFELVGTLVALWGYHTARGDLARADSLLDDIVATGITDDPVMRAENETARGMVRFFQGEFEESERLLRRAVESVPEDVGDARPLSPWEFPNDAVTFMLAQYGLARWQRGDLDGFRHFIERAQRRAERLPRPYGPFNLAYTLTHEAWVLTEVGRYAEADGRVRELLDVSERYGFDFWTLAGTTADAIVRGRAALAVQRQDEQFLTELVGRLGGTSTMTQMIDARLLLPYGLTVQAELAAAAGDHDTALELFDRALVVADETGSQFYRAETYRLRSRTRRVTGDPSACDDLEAAVELAYRQGSIPFEIRARCDLAELGETSSRLDELCAEPAHLVAAGISESSRTPTS